MEDVQIENLKIPFTAVVTDIIRGRKVWINKGFLFDATQTSISLPLFFDLVHKGEDVFIDVGVMNPLPIAFTLNDNMNLTTPIHLGADPINKIEKTN